MTIDDNIHKPCSVEVMLITKLNIYEGKYSRRCIRLSCINSKNYRQIVQDINCMEIFTAWY